MARGDFENELALIQNDGAPKNYEVKFLCELVLDVSGSMCGTPITELNNGIRSFLKELQDDFEASQRVEVEVITFGSSVEMIQKPALSGDVSIPTLTEGGGTPMCRAIDLAIQSAEAWKSTKKANGEGYYRPWIVVITDGYPDDYNNGYELKFAEAKKNKNFVFLPVGVGGADMSFLNKIAGEFGATELHNLNFKNIMKLIFHSAPGEAVDFVPLVI